MEDPFEEDPNKHDQLEEFSNEHHHLDEISTKRHQLEDVDIEWDECYYDKKMMEDEGIAKGNKFYTLIFKFQI